MDDIICPHCGSKTGIDDVYEDEERECGVCEGEMKIEVHHSFSFTTKIKGKRITN